MLVNAAMPYGSTQVATADWAPVSRLDWLVVGGFMAVIALLLAVYVILDRWWNAAPKSVDAGVVVPNQRHEAAAGAAEAVQQAGVGSLDTPPMTPTDRPHLGDSPR